MKLNAPSILVLTQCSNMEKNLCSDLQKEGYRTICISCKSLNDQSHFNNIAAIFVESEIIKEQGWSYLKNLRKDIRVPILVLATKHEDVIPHLQVFRNVSYVNQDTDGQEVKQIIQGNRRNEKTKVCSRWEEPLSATA